MLIILRIGLRIEVSLDLGTHANFDGLSCMTSGRQAN